MRESARVDGHGAAAGGAPEGRGWGRARLDHLLTVAIVAVLAVAVVIAAANVRRPPVGSSCVDDWNQLSAAVSAYRADGGQDVSQQTLLDGTYLADRSEHFDVDSNGAIVPIGPAPLVCS
ncbi:MAG TPA: hypothetical protein VNQ73_20885 [Ilumatobacter sp.]|nr:hypothetical protein [Ilumatobacter sp.]